METEEDHVYIRWDTRADSAWGEKCPVLLSVHKTLEGAVEAITPTFRCHEQGPTGRYIRDFTWEAVEKRVLKP